MLRVTARGYTVYQESFAEYNFCEFLDFTIFKKKLSQIAAFRI